MKNYTNKNNRYISKLSYTSWRTLFVLRFTCSYYLNEKYHLSLSPYFRNNPRAGKLGLYTRNKKYKIIEGTIVQTMLWSWSLYLIEWLFTLFDWWFSSIQVRPLYVDFSWIPGFAIMSVHVFIYPGRRNVFGSLQQKETQNLESTCYYCACNN